MKIFRTCNAVYKFLNISKLTNNLSFIYKPNIQRGFTLVFSGKKSDPTYMSAFDEELVTCNEGWSY